MEKHPSFGFYFGLLLIWMAVVVSVQSLVVDDDYYTNTILRDEMFNQMESVPSVRYYRMTPKRSSLIWNPLVIALRKALNSESEPTKDTHVNYPVSSSKNMEQLSSSGSNHGKVYWRCYFNAVSCFTKK